MFRVTQPIFAAVRLDESGTEVLRQSVELAGHYKVKLYICHVLHDLLSVRPLFPQVHLENAVQFAEFEATARSALFARAAAFTNIEREGYELLIEYGTEHSAILRAAERVDAGLIVVGHGSQEHSLSGVSERIVRYAHCPVLIARREIEGCVLAGTDFSDPATPAVEAAVSEAQRRRRDLNIIHAVDIAPFILPPDGMTTMMYPIEFPGELRRALQERLDSCVAKASAKGGILADGAADSAILEATVSLPADLVVVGTHGRTGLRRLALGSIAESIVKEARCSVLVVRLDS